MDEEYCGRHRIGSYEIWAVKFLLILANYLIWWLSSSLGITIS